MLCVFYTWQDPIESRDKLPHPHYCARDLISDACARASRVCDWTRLDSTLMWVVTGPFDGDEGQDPTRESELGDLCTLYLIHWTPSRVQAFEARKALCTRKEGCRPPHLKQEDFQGTRSVYSFRISCLPCCKLTAFPALNIHNDSG